ncbi:MAG TPA: dephospho-CoA kinase [Verrucomicrobium sp.]|nr:dephospho-CoA kinase [Verrucomicrobium sp.]
METWIITGGAASGKSTFCKLLAEGSPRVASFSSDAAVHHIYQDKETASKLAHVLDESVVGPDGLVSRPALRELAFRDPSMRGKLEKFLHPQVYAMLEDLQATSLEGGKVQVLIAEVPLFYESQSDFPADAVIVVASESKLQHDRMTGERGLNADTAQRILDIQLPLRRKLDLADKVVWNEGSPELLRLQSQLLLQQLV